MDLTNLTDHLRSLSDVKINLPGALTAVIGLWAAWLLLKWGIRSLIKGAFGLLALITFPNLITGAIVLGAGTLGLGIGDINSPVADRLFCPAFRGAIIGGGAAAVVCCVTRVIHRFGPA
jgi:hypothetical protein